MFRRQNCLGMCVFAALVFSVTAWAAPLRLVVQLTIDGLPTELLLRHVDRLNPEGLGKIAGTGMVYTGAEIPWTTTFTAVGHAGLFTGALPAWHGIIGNEWLDRESGEEVYCVEDPRHTTLDAPGKPHEGTSPANLLSTTIGDELIRATDRRAKVFSVSTKDRGAILPAGKFGKAFWYHKGAGTMVTSTYYYPESPTWLVSWRERFPISRYRHAVWTLARDPKDYDRLDLDRREVEKGPLGAIFPHDLGVLSDTQLPAELPWTPFIDEWTLELALTILKEEQLGQDDVPDMLCVSFSAMDYVHHRYGPDSLESEDTLYRVDALIARLLNELDGLVGLEHTLIAVSSDHGFGRAPEQVRAEGLSAERITRDQLEAQLADLSGQLSRTAGSGIIARFMSPFIYLRHENGQPVNASLREEAARIAETWPWTAWVATVDRLRAGGVSRDVLFERATTSFRTDRGGDVLVIARPWYIVETAETAWSATHGSPYAYDTRVPMVFAGPGIAAGWVSRSVSPLDITATLAACLNITPPPACSGTPLPEIVDGFAGR